MAWAPSTWLAGGRVSENPSVGHIGVDCGIKMVTFPAREGDVLVAPTQHPADMVIT